MVNFIFLERRNNKQKSAAFTAIQGQLDLYNCFVEFLSKSLKKVWQGWWQRRQWLVAACFRPPHHHPLPPTPWYCDCQWKPGNPIHCFFSFCIIIYLCFCFCGFPMLIIKFFDFGIKLVKLFTKRKPPSQIILANLIVL